MEARNLINYLQLYSMASWWVVAPCSKPNHNCASSMMPLDHLRLQQVLYSLILSWLPSHHRSLGHSLFNRGQHLIVF